MQFDVPARTVSVENNTKAGYFLDQETLPDHGLIQKGGILSPSVTSDIRGLLRQSSQQSIQDTADRLFTKLALRVNQSVPKLLVNETQGAVFVRRPEDQVVFRALCVTPDCGSLVVLDDVATISTTIDVSEGRELLQWAKESVLEDRICTGVESKRSFERDVWSLGDLDTPLVTFFPDQTRIDALTERYAHELLSESMILADGAQALARLVAQSTIDYATRLFNEKKALFFSAPEVTAESILHLPITAYNFVVESDHSAVRTNRMRWVSSFPALWGVHGHHELGEVIDSGEGFIDRYCSLTQTPPSHLKRFRTISASICPADPFDRSELYLIDDDLDYQEGDREPDISLIEIPETKSPFHEKFISSINPALGRLITPLIVQALADIPTNKLPSPQVIEMVAREMSRRSNPCLMSELREQPSVITLRACWKIAQSLSRDEGLDIFHDRNSWLRILVSSTKGNWEEHAVKIGRFPEAVLENILDYVRSATYSLIVPQLLRNLDALLPGQREDPAELIGLATKRLGHYLFKNRGIAKVVEFSSSWHKLTEGTSNYQFVDWQPWCAPLKFKNGISCTPLTNSSELAVEGQEMHHCVGSYVSLCMSGDTQIFSLRDAANRRLSTLQVQVVNEKISPKESRLVFSVIQNKGVANGSPAIDAQIAGETLVKLFNQGKITHSVKSALEQGAKFNRNQICGFDYDDDAAWGQAREMFLCYLTAKERQLTPSQFSTLVMETDFLSQEMRGAARKSGSSQKTADNVLGWLLDK